MREDRAFTTWTPNRVPRKGKSTKPVVTNTARSGLSLVSCVAALAISARAISTPVVSYCGHASFERLGGYLQQQSSQAA